MMSLENALWLAGIAAETAVVLLLIYRRVWRVVPIFCAYCAWDLLSNAVTLPVLHYFPRDYSALYLIETVVDSALVFGVLVELAWSVLRPIRNSLPRRTPVFIGILILAVGAAIWPFAGIRSLSILDPGIRGIVHVQQTASILRVLVFLVMAGCSQVLSIGWRHRELQVATGLGFYSLVSLGAAMLHTHETTVNQYGHLNQFVVASYLCSLLYWVFSFAQKEAERREFTPQMQNFLLAVAGVARADRVALTDSSAAEERRRRKP